MSHYKLKSCSKRPKAIPTDGPRRRAGRPPQVVWGSRPCLSLQRNVKPNRRSWPEGEITFRLKTGSGFIWACEQGIQARYFGYQLGKKVTLVISCTGGGILPEGAELDPNCCFLSASRNSSPWLKPNFYSIFFLQDAKLFGYIFSFPCLAKVRTVSAKMLSESLFFFLRNSLTTTAYPKATSSWTKFNSWGRGGDRARDTDLGHFSL